MSSMSVLVSCCLVFCLCHVTFCLVSQAAHSEESVQRSAFNICLEITPEQNWFRFSIVLCGDHSRLNALGLLLTWCLGVVPGGALVTIGDVRD